VPEGDTIFRTAEVLRAALAGKVVTGLRSPLPALAEAGLPGRRVTAVEPRGKHLLIRFDDGRVLHTHMRMTGSWHVYRPAERWRKPGRQARVALEVEGFVAVCFNAPVVQLLTARGAARDRALTTLGPDLLAPDFDPVAARQGLRRHDDRPIGEALLAQQALAGIGNIYKSETLFLCGVNPFAPVAALSDADLDALVAKARALMSANLSGAPRRTVPLGRGAGRLWVYGRSGEPCRRCGATVRMRRQGEAARSTYWCPSCQPPPVIEEKQRP
jgi:endonuclease-8